MLTQLLEIVFGILIIMFSAIFLIVGLAIIIAKGMVDDIKNRTRGDKKNE